jgi:chemosensory pili system protein ChpA (sensor histidine kinase/response regulator)
MSEDKEKEVKLLFLEEAVDYLNNMESGLLGLGSKTVDRQTIDSILRAAHSIKGGAAMMGYSILSHLAHRLEDFFKVLKFSKGDIADEQIEGWLLESVDYLRQIIVLKRQGKQIDQTWVDTNINPILDRLHFRLGDPKPEDPIAILAKDLDDDITNSIFESEVEEYLEKLEQILATGDSSNLAEELLAAAQDLSGLGEMLDLPAFSHLSLSVIEHIEQQPERLTAIAKAAVSTWRRSQALVLVNQTTILPTRLDLDLVETPIETLVAREEDLDFENISIEILDSTLALQEITPTSQELLSSVENFYPQQNNLIQEEPEEISNIFAHSPKNKTIASKQLEANNPISNESGDNTIRVSLQQIERLSELFGEFTIERNGIDLQLKGMRNSIALLSQRVKILEQSNFRLRIAYDKVATQANSFQRDGDVQNDLDTNNRLNNDREAITSTKYNLILQDDRYFDALEMDSYNDIHLMSQEVMETVVQLQEVTKDIEINLEETERNARELTRTYKKMQNSLIQVRMRPLSDLVSRFPRALRDMEIQYGKKVELRVKGGGTLVDRTILEALNEPLLHLFRNAFDHGIEAPEIRRIAGKPEQGIIEIAASYRGSQTIIAISDDGKGIDLDKIRARAMEMGLNKSDMEQVSERELLELIFEPGFSTAEHLTDLSGRGVGMDIVLTNLQKVKGQIQVDTKFGLGTTFTISVPFTLSVVRVLLVESKGMLLAFPSNSVEEMLPLENDKISAKEGKEMLDWQGYMLELIRLGEWLNVERRDSAIEMELIPTINEPTLLMVGYREELVALQVDRYWREEEVTVRQIEGPLKLPPGFSGCTILGDGRVIPLVETDGLIDWIVRQRQLQNTQIPVGKSLSELKVTPKELNYREKNTVMVIDDSIAVRRFLAQTLERANYRVEQAKDGQDALEKIQTGIKVHAIVCDIEMPRLDGFGFLSQVKADPKNKDLPILMLTSRSGNKHRQLAMNLGATGYFSKPFQEKELLQTLHKLVVKNENTHWQ